MLTWASALEPGKGNNGVEVLKTPAQDMNSSIEKTECREEGVKALRWKWMGRHSRMCKSYSRVVFLYYGTIMSKYDWVY